MDIKNISFKDWWVIAQKMKVWNSVAFKSWCEFVSPEIIQGLTIDQWEEVASELDYSPNWAANKYQEHRKRENPVLR